MKTVLLLGLLALCAVEVIAQKVPTKSDSIMDDLYGRPIPKKTYQEANIDQLVDGIEKFRQQRDLGKGTMFAGILVTGIGAVLQANDTNGKTDYKALYIAGGVLFTAGFVIDWSAGRHLRFKK